MEKINNKQGEMRPNPTNRPTFADFGLMLADTIRDFCTVTHDDGRMNDEKTANEVIGRLASFLDCLNDEYTQQSDFNALLDVIHAYTLKATTEKEAETANKALRATKSALNISRLTEVFRSEINAVIWTYNKYDEAQCAANIAETDR